MIIFIFKGFDGPGKIEIYSIIGNKIKDLEIQKLKFYFSFPFKFREYVYN